jgi:hypothetical protein
MSAHPLITMTSLVLAMLATSAHALACLGAGRAVQWALGPRRAAHVAMKSHDAWIDLATQFLAGVVAFNAVLTVLGLLGWLRPVPVGVFQALGWLALVALRPTGNGLRAALRATFDEVRGLNWPLRILGVVLVLFFSCLGLAALLTPPTGDAEAFYMAYANILASSGVLEPMRGTYRVFSSIGLPAELHFATLIGWQGTPAAKLFVFPVALASGVFLAGIVGRCGGGVIARWVSWVILVSSSSFTLYVYDGKVDLFGAAFALAALYWLLQNLRQDDRRSAMAWAGLMAGSATVAKFSYVLTLGVAMLVLLAWQHRRTPSVNGKFDAPGFCRACLVLAAWAAIAWLPQCLKNGVFYGAPLAPFLGMGETGSWLNQVWHSPEITRHILLTYPYALVFGQYPMQGGGVSPLLLVLPALAWLLLRRRGDGALAAVTAAALLSTIAWMLVRPSVLAPRYILATLLLFAPLAALAAEAALTNRRWWLRIGTAALLVLALKSAINEVQPGPMALLQWANGRGERCLQASPSCKPLSALATEGGAGERVLLAGYYGYWMRPDQLQCRDDPMEQDQIKKATDIMAALQAGGFRYAVIERSSHGWLEERLLEETPPVRRLGPRGHVVVYELPSNTTLQRWRCVETRPGQWTITQIESPGS